jgi:hypothetical protein
MNRKMRELAGAPKNQRAVITETKLCCWCVRANAACHPIAFSFLCPIRPTLFCQGQIENAVHELRDLMFTTISEVRELQVYIYPYTRPFVPPVDYPAHVLLQKAVRSLPSLPAAAAATLAPPLVQEHAPSVGDGNGVAESVKRLQTAHEDGLCV